MTGTRKGKAETHTLPLRVSASIDKRNTTDLECQYHNWLLPRHKAMARKERERRYISEYMLSTFPEGGWQLNVELGPIPQEYVDRYGLGKAAALFRPTRPRVDAVKWSPSAYYIIEAKIRDIKAGIGDLTYYKGMVAQTPDLPFYDNQPIICRLVVPWMIDWIKTAADAVGVDVAVFWSDWIADYVKERQHYFTAEYRAERADKMRMREILGVD
jgi:hypothetical protein